MESVQDQLRTYWLNRFSAVWREVCNDRQILDVPPDLSFQLSNRLSSRRAARISGSKRIVIEVSARFVLDLENGLSDVQSALADLLYDSSVAERLDPAEVLELFREFTSTFVILHEIFHLIAGHVGWILRKQSSLGFDEQGLGLQSKPNRQREASSYLPYSAAADAYLLESEADCTAAQWMILSMSQPTLQRLLGTRTRTIMTFPKQRRVVAFRLVVASLWLVIRRMESARRKIIENSSKTHPLPATRAFIVFGECLRAYSVVGDVRYDSRGGGQHTLSGEDVRSMDEFLKKVLRPVLQSDWNPGSESLPPSSLEAQLLHYFPDFANHLLNRPVETAVGREMLRMERTRFRMDRSLRPFRYYRAAELKRLEPQTEGSAQGKGLS
jgi:hypothetical protein